MIDFGPSLSFQGFLFLHLFPAGDQWSFLTACCVSSFSPLQILQDTARLRQLFCLLVCLLGHFPWLQCVQDSTSIGVLKGGCQTLSHAGLGFPFHLLLFAAGLLKLCGRWQVQSWQSPLKAIEQRAYIWPVTASISVVKLVVKTLFYGCRLHSLP